MQRNLITSELVGFAVHSSNTWIFKFRSFFLSKYELVWDPSWFFFAFFLCPHVSSHHNLWGVCVGGAQAVGVGHGWDGQARRDGSFVVARANPTPQWEVNIVWYPISITEHEHFQVLVKGAGK